MDFTQINFLAVLVGTIAAFALGAIWYNTKVFGSIWQKEVGMSKEDAEKGNVAMIMIFSFVFMFVMALGMAFLMGHSENGFDWKSGLFHGLIIGIVFNAMGLAINAVYEMRSFRLWAINAFYQIISLIIMGIIIGLWN